jgi:uncharacterized protein
MTARATIDVARRERSALLDALRGFALLGVLAANMISFSGALIAHTDTSRAASVAAFGLDWLVHGKFYSIFSLLFGVGFALQIARIEARGESLILYVRRLAILFLIGLAHLVFLYRGDILVLYALVGLVLILCRRLDSRLLPALAAALWIAPLGWAMLMAFLGFAPHAPLHALGLDIYRMFGVDVSGGIPYFISRDPSYLHYVEMGLAGIFVRLGNLVQELRPAKVLAMFLIGLWIGRRALHERLQEEGGLLRTTLGWGLAIGLPGSALMAWGIALSPEPSSAWWPVLEAAFYSLGVPTLALAYAAGFALLWRRASSRKYLSWMAPAGRMALSNYLLQSVIQATFFAGWGLGCYGLVSIAWIPVASLAVFVLQVAFSRVWLSIFSAEPFEWLWRSLAAGRFQPVLLPRV